jgi:hypothetical protein
MPPNCLALFGTVTVSYTIVRSRINASSTWQLLVNRFFVNLLSHILGNVARGKDVRQINLLPLRPVPKVRRALARAFSSIIFLKNQSAIHPRAIKGYGKKRYQCGDFTFRGFCIMMDLVFERIAGKQWVFLTMCFLLFIRSAETLSV